MPGFRIIDRYIAAEVAGPLGLGVILLTFALVTGRLLKLTEMVVNHGVTLGDVMGLIGFIMPAFLELTLPMALLLGVLMSDARDAKQQNTIIAHSGRIIPDPTAQAITLRLFDGSVFGVSAADNTSHVTSFRTYDLSVHPEEGLGIAAQDP